MSNATHKTDVAIIGAGPVGLFAIFECGMLRMQCHVIDALEMIGGQCSALYPEKPIYDIPAHPEITGQDLTAQLEKQAAPFNPTYHLGQQVEKLTQTENGNWILETSLGTTIESKAVIIAAGVGAFGPKKPPLENIEQYEGKSVFYMVKKREDFRDKRIVIAGGGDSALDWAVSLAEVAQKIMVIHRREKFRGAPDTVAKLHALADKGKIELVVPYQLKALEGANGKIENVVVSTLDGAEKKLPTDYLLPFFGLSMQLGPIANWNLNLDNHHITVDPLTGQTNQPGIYAIGDIATYKNKLKLILCGFSEAAFAAHSIYKLVHPDIELHFEYSTTKGLPGAA